jgi:hypothetical protein
VICSDFVATIFPGLLQAVAFAMTMLFTRHCEPLMAKQSRYEGIVDDDAGMSRAMFLRIAHE